MAKDYDPNGTPPQWALDMASDESRFTSGSRPSVATFMMCFPEYRALARRIWRTEEPPVDPILAVVREAIARYEEKDGYTTQAGNIRNGASNNSITAALSYLREVGALVDKLP